MDTRNVGSLVPVAHQLEYEPTWCFLYNYFGDLIWSPNEIQRLINVYGKTPKETLLLLFPDRSWNAILCKAHEMKITCKGWTAKDDNLIVDLIGYGLNSKQMKNLFENRTESAIYQRVYMIRKKMEEYR